MSVLNSLDSSKASLNIILTGVGDVTEGDLKIAQSINGKSVFVQPLLLVFGSGLVLGFGTARTKAIERLVEQYRITLLTDDVIYHLLGQLKV